MKYDFIILSLLTLLACNSKPVRPPYSSTGSQTLDFGPFTLKAPGWRKFTEQGIDSYVGGLTNGKDSLTFDYGWYSQDIETTAYSQSLYGLDTINGLEVLIKIPKIPGNGEIAMSIENAGGGNKFYISGRDIPETQTILDIFQSIYFRQRHASINHYLTIRQFTSGLPSTERSAVTQSEYAAGATLFTANCSGCHSKIKIMVAPALSVELMKTRSAQWLYTFLTDRKHLVKDSAYKSRVKDFSPSQCPEQPLFQRKDILSLLTYLGKTPDPIY